MFSMRGVIRSIEKRAEEEEKHIKKRVREGIERAFITSQKVVPVLTGDLKASGTVDEDEDGLIFASYGDQDDVYYAVGRHEDQTKVYFKFLEIPMLSEIRSAFQDLGAEDE